MKRIILISCLLFTAFVSVLKAETYVVSVGIANYQNISSLRLCENDAITISKIYKTKTKNVITITGRYATRAYIVKALSDQFARAKKGDMIVFFFSGHGYEGGFCPYDAGAKNQSALSYDDIYTIFKKSKASHKIIIADACMSGGLRQEDSTNSPHRSNSDVVLFLSSRTDETSIESSKMKNGYFTAYLDRGLRGGADTNKDKKITAKEIFTYVSNGVKEISDDRQHPVMWGNFDDRFVMINWNK